MIQQKNIQAPAFVKLSAHFATVVAASAAKHMKVAFNVHAAENRSTAAPIGVLRAGVVRHRRCAGIAGMAYSTSF